MSKVERFVISESQQANKPINYDRLILGRVVGAGVSSRGRRFLRVEPQEVIPGFEVQPQELQLFTSFGVVFVPPTRETAPNIWWSVGQPLWPATVSQHLLEIVCIQNGNDEILFTVVENRFEPGKPFAASGGTLDSYQAAMAAIRAANPIL